jgi:hypothetical protein
MSARFIVILIGVALMVAFFFLPRGIGGTVLLVLGGIALFASLAEVGRQLFYDARWMIARMMTKHLPPPRLTGEAGRGRATESPCDR